MQVLTMLGALDGGSPCPMSILKKNNVALSNVRNAPVTLSILKNGHISCYSIFNLMSHVTKPQNAHVAVSILGANCKGHMHTLTIMRSYRRGKGVILINDDIHSQMCNVCTYICAMKMRRYSIIAMASG